NRARESLAAGNIAAVRETLENAAGALAGASRQTRHELLPETALGSSASSALRITDTFLSLERTGLHIWRICHYLSQGRSGNPVSQEGNGEDGIMDDGLQAEAPP